jgi:hypothetical protein
MATVPFDFACDMSYCFVPDPNEHERVGYVTALAGLGMAEALRADLTVTSPLTRVATPVVGVIARFDWAGGVGDPLKIDMYVSQENAVQVKALQHRARRARPRADCRLDPRTGKSRHRRKRVQGQRPDSTGSESGVCPHIRQQLHQASGQSLGPGDREPDLTGSLTSPGA